MSLNNLFSRHLAALLLSAFAVQAFGQSPAESIAVAPQYSTSHVYVAAADIDRFVASFVGTFGGRSTRRVVTTVTPTPSSTTSQLLQTPSGSVSLFGFRTPIPYPFGTERTGYLVRDMDAAVQAARSAGADVLVAPFPDAIGRDAIIQWPGGVNMQLYWHTAAPSYPPTQAVPENRIYVSPVKVATFVQGFLAFSRGHVVSDETSAPGIEIGRAGDSFRRIRIESAFGKMALFVTDGHLPYPYGYETTGYEVPNLRETLAKATALGVTILVPPYTSSGRDAAIVQFPGGYIAEIHSAVAH